jgi:hypothetical protein
VKKKPVRIKHVAIVALCIVVAAAAIASWRIFSMPGLQPMNLTLVAKDGTALALDEKALGEFTPYESRGGFKTSVGSLRGIGEYTGVPILALCSRVGGIDDTCSVRITAGDGYSMVFTYDQANGRSFTTFDPATGDEVCCDHQLTVVLAYHHNGENLPVDEGPLRLAILNSEGLLTEGHWWVKCIVKIEVRSAIEEWALLLKGALVENMTRATFESGVNEHCHGVNWTDSNHNVWTGMPLWLLVGRVDDGNVHETNSSVRAFNDTLALQGYIVKVVTGQGYSCEFASNSTRYMRSSDIILANGLNGAPLPEPYWPLKLIGKGLLSNEMLGNVVEIQIIFPGS